MAGGGRLGFACACGKLRGEVTDAAPAAYTHILCHCGDCRSACVHLGHPDPGKVDILQTTQDRIRIAEGGENLRVFRLTPKGTLRWYAACCDTPLFITPLSARLVHVGLNADRLDKPAAVGRVVAEGFIPTRDGKQRHKGMLRMISRLASRIVARNLDGRWRESPFFDADGDPVRAPRILDREERAAALLGLRA